jgi:hypothetical protein
MAAASPGGSGDQSLTRSQSDDSDVTSTTNRTPTPASRTRKSSRLVYGAVVIVVVVLALLLVYMPGGPLRPTSPASDVETLAPSGWNSQSLPDGQFADITFVIQSTERLNGSFLTENTIQAYVMNNTDFQSLVIKDIVTGYQWTSGDVWKGWINDTVVAGSWHLVFLNVDPYTASGVGVIQAITLTPV